RQSACDCTAAKALDKGGFSLSLEPRFREPGRKLGDLGLGHGSNHKSSATEGQRVRFDACACASGAITVARPKKGVARPLSGHRALVFSSTSYIILLDLTSARRRNPWLFASMTPPQTSPPRRPKGRSISINGSATSGRSCFPTPRTSP